jgi:sorbose reductase
MALTDRDLLSARKIPHMVFGTGTGLCAPPPPPSIYLPAEDRARARFSVNGNAIVTGGGGTLGSEAARALLEHGASGLMIFDISGALCQKAQVELQADFPEAKIGFVVVDITNEKEVESAISKTVETLGSVDILLCFAGVVHTQHALQMTAVEWRRMLEINTTGTFLCAQAAGKIMVQQGRGGRIVLVSNTDSPIVRVDLIGDLRSHPYLPIPSTGHNRRSDIM